MTVRLINDEQSAAVDTVMVRTGLLELSSSIYPRDNTGVCDGTVWCLLIFLTYNQFVIIFRSDQE